MVRRLAKIVSNLVERRAHLSASLIRMGVLLRQMQCKLGVRLLCHTEVVFVGTCTTTVYKQITLLKLVHLREHRSVSVHPFSLRHRVDYCLNWPLPHLSLPPFFIFLLLTFIEAFLRNSPLAIHFLKWSYRGGKKACSVPCVYVIYKWSQAYFHFFLSSAMFSVSCADSLDLLVCFVGSFHILFFLILTPHHLFFPLVFIVVFFLSRPAVSSFEPVLWRGVQKLPYKSSSRQPLRFYLQ